MAVSEAPARIANPPVLESPRQIEAPAEPHLPLLYPDPTHHHGNGRPVATVTSPSAHKVGWTNGSCASQFQAAHDVSASPSR